MLSYEFFNRFLISKRAGSLVKTISRISLIGIWLGVCSLVLVMSVMNGFNRSIRDRLLEVEPHLVVSFDEIKSLAAIKKLDSYQILEKMDIDLIAPISQQDVILRTPEGFVQEAIARGVTRERLYQLLEYGNRRNGTNDPELEEKIKSLNANEVILGVGLADKIGLFRDDSMVIIPPETFLMAAGEIPTLSQATVRGFIATDVDRIDSRTFYYILDESFPRLRNSMGRVLGLHVWLNDPEKADMVKTQLANENTKIETWKERNASLFFALRLEKFVISFLVGLSTLIAGLSIISVMVLLLTQKKKDVGNLLAMGMTRSETKKTFVNIGMYLSLTGVVGGVISGIVLSLLVNRYSEDMLPAFYQETNIPAEIHFWQVSMILILAVSFSFIALNLTMNRLSSYKPSEILRG